MFSSITLLTYLLLIIVNNFRVSLMRYSAALIDIKLLVRATDSEVIIFIIVFLVILFNYDSIDLLFIFNSSLLLLLLQSFLMYSESRLSDLLQTFEVKTVIN